MELITLAPSRAKLAALAGLASLLLGTAAEAKERYYRDVVDTPTAPPSRYAVEVPENATAVGGLSIVDEDESGRIVSVTSQQDGVRQEKTVYEYAGDTKFPGGYTSYDRDGVLTGKVTIQRDAEGRVLGLEDYTAQGVLTGRTTVSYSGGRANISVFAADGSLTETDEEYFDDSGAETRMVARYGGRTSDTSFDPKRGVILSQLGIDGGRTTITRKFSYGSDDELKRIDVYDSRGQWYGDNIFANNLMTEKHYKLRGGEAEDEILTYDRHRWLSAVNQSINGTLVCTFQFDRLPDGTIKRTLVLAPDGTPLEEFPNNEVDGVNRDGSAPAGYPRTTYKHGNLW